MEEENDIQETEKTTEFETVEETPVLSEEQFNSYIETVEEQQKESLELQAEHHEELIQSLQSTNESVSSIPQVDNSDLVAKMDELIATINSYSGVFEVIEMGSSSLITYAVFYVPLFLIVGCLWWFFKQFIR